MDVTYYFASSIDGFIASEDGDVSWMEGLGVPYDEEGYAQFISSVDGLIMGRKTYDMIQGFNAWFYGDRPTWVCTRKSVDAFAGCNLQPEQSPLEAVAEARHLGLKNLWLLGGGVLAAKLINAKLIDRVIITQMPIILGAGIPMADSLSAPLKLRLVSTKTTTSGLSQLVLDIQKNSEAAAG